MAFVIPQDIEQGSNFLNAGIYPFRGTISFSAAELVDTTLTKAAQKFGPDGGSLWYLKVDFDDLDGATPTLTFDIVLVDSAGTVVTTLVAGADQGQTGSVSAALALGAGTALPESTGDLFLALKVAAAATNAQAGDVRVIGLASPNV